MSEIVILEPRSSEILDYVTKRGVKECVCSEDPNPHYHITWTEGFTYVGPDQVSLIIDVRGKP